MEHYDLIVIGGGPSGYAGAMRALDFNKKVLLHNKNDKELLVIDLRQFFGHISGRFKI